MDHRTIELRTAFKQSFGSDAQVAVRAPGRVNLIGEHTDYNDGFCLPMAIERDVLIAYRSRSDTTVRVLSLQQKNLEIFDVGPSEGNRIHKSSQVSARWADYIKGCAQVLREEGLKLHGVDMALTGDVPLGSGLSSSAALEVATMLALLGANGLTFSAEKIAKLAQRAENTYVGTQCGILDQLSSACAVHGQAMLMDCRTLALTPAPLPKGISVVIADTGKRRGLVDSAYNERRAQCEAGARALGVSHLRDVSMAGLWQARQAGKLDAVALKRCEHVVAENGRTVAAFACLTSGNAEAFGQLMDQSHADLRDKFEVSCRELDDMVAISRALPGCLGSRMTGAGFGGCTVSLVKDEHTSAFASSLASAYKKLHDLPMAVYLTCAAAGAGPVVLG
ncbi:MAG: galactokinase [Planctomycetes bacterium]|nr:galactokinase [Planctomycetota bacterium]